MSDGQQVLILGGGLAGLSFAIALATETPSLGHHLVGSASLSIGNTQPHGYSGFSVEPYIQ